ncbi:MAG TPA: hypothetical protein VHT75_08985 [Acidimicrobiales bacterium]|jgi:hypothetical protein|nr:hypothetical protein [Acidimicrobiales bacterium]
MITPRRAVISLVLAFAAALMVYGFTQVRPTNSPVVIRNSAVRAEFPPDGASALRQSMISVQLAAGYTLAYQNSEGMAISVNRGSAVGIPQDELQVNSGTNQYTFSPGPGRTLTELPAGRVCVNIRITRTTNLADSGQPFGWCFTTL